MKINHLRYFNTLANLRNFREAAEVCRVSQPAMSMAIRAFEDRLGQKLFIRQSTPVELSPFGREILPYVERILFEYENMLQVGEKDDGDLSGHLRMGVIPTIAPYLLPRIIGKFRDSFPNVILDIEEQLTQVVVDSIATNDLDVGIIATPVNPLKLEAKPMYYEEFMAYSSEPGGKSYILPRDIDIKKLWILKEGHCFRNQIVNLCELERRENAELNYHAGSIETLVNLVDHYGGVTIIPELAAEELSPSRKKKLKLFQSPAPVREISLIFHKYTIKMDHILALAEVIDHSIPRHMKEKESFTNVPI